MKIHIFLPLISRSAKKSFQILRARAPFFCAALQKEIFVSRQFFNHISNNTFRKRRISDLLERLLMIPFIDEILEKGKLVETREHSQKVFFQISKMFFKEKYSVIIVKVHEKHSLLSCFIDSSFSKK